MKIEELDDFTITCKKSQDRLTSFSFASMLLEDVSLHLPCPCWHNLNQDLLTANIGNLGLLPALATQPYPDACRQQETCLEDFAWEETCCSSWNFE